MEITLVKTNNFPNQFRPSFLVFDLQVLKDILHHFMTDVNC